MTLMRPTTPTLPLPPSLSFSPMREDDLTEVLVIENDIYPHPWTRGNFLDSLDSNYETWVLRAASGILVGYFLLMMAVDDAHLLNITVRGGLHGQGIGRLMLDKTVQLARDHHMSAILLEVRLSNERALAVYERYGFFQIGLRKDYYPAANQTREDAVVMRLML